MCMGERAKCNSADQEELCPHAENTAGCQQISTPVLQPLSSVCLQSGGGGYQWLCTAGVGQAFVGLCMSKSVSHPLQVSGISSLGTGPAGKQCLFLEQREELSCLLSIPGLEFVKCRSQGLVSVKLRILDKKAAAQIAQRSRKNAS